LALWPINASIESDMVFPLTVVKLKNAKYVRTTIGGHDFGWLGD